MTNTEPFEPPHNGARWEPPMVVKLGKDTEARVTLQGRIEIWECRERRAQIVVKEGQSWIRGGFGSIRSGKPATRKIIAAQKIAEDGRRVK